MENTLESIIDKFKNFIDDDSYSQGSTVGINFNLTQKLNWEISNSNNLPSGCSAEIETVDQAVTIINKFSNNAEITIEYLRQKFVINWTKPIYLHIYKAP